MILNRSKQNLNKSLITCAYFFDGELEPVGSKLSSTIKPINQSKLTLFIYLFIIFEITWRIDTNVKWHEVRIIVKNVMAGPISSTNQKYTTGLIKMIITPYQHNVWRAASLVPENPVLKPCCYIESKRSDTICAVSLNWQELNTYTESCNREEAVLCATVECGQCLHHQTPLWSSHLARLCQSSLEASGGRGGGEMKCRTIHYLMFTFPLGEIHQHTSILWHKPPISQDTFWGPINTTYRALFILLTRAAVTVYLYEIFWRGL